MNFFVSKTKIPVGDIYKINLIKNVNSDPEHYFNYVYFNDINTYGSNYYRGFSLYDNLYEIIILYDKIIFLKWFVKSKRYHKKKNVMVIYFRRRKNYKIQKFLKTHNFKIKNKYLKGYKKH